MLYKTIAVLATVAALTTTLAAEINKWPSVEEDHTKLQIIVPDTLQRKGGYPHRDALFGFPSYSKGSLQVQLINANSTACDDDTLQRNDAWQPPYGLLLQRGDCHFTTKVRNAQHAGAAAVIIEDNTCLCTDTDCMTSTKDTTCETVLPFMADDASGGDITIPSMLIRKSDGIQIRNELKEANGLSNVMVQFDWGIPSPDGRVEWTLWHSAWDPSSAKALQDMESIVTALGSRAFFTPRFVSYNGSNVGCHSFDSNSTSNPCGSMCLNDGRYCLLDPSPFHDQEIGASGADVVRENLRRKCIWEVVSKEDPGVGKLWWRYVNEFASACNTNEELFKDPACGEKVVKQVGGIDSKKVEECMGAVGEEVDSDNAKLDEEVAEQTQLQLLRLPALYVDGVHARGRINAANMMAMICAGYGTHDPPAVCSCVDSLPAVSSSMDISTTTTSDISTGGLMECVSHGSYAAWMEANDAKNGNGGGVSFGGVLFIVLLAVGSGGLVGLVHWQRSQRQMRDQVRSILAEYMPLEDQSLDGEGEPTPRGGGMMQHPAMVASAKSPRGFLASGTDTEDFDQEL